MADESAMVKVAVNGVAIFKAEQAEAEQVNPDGRAEPLPNHEVKITFVKRGHDGVKVESQCATEATWTYLPFDGFSPSVDNARRSSRPALRNTATGAPR